MTIRKKTLCVIFSVLLLMGSVIYTVTRLVLLDGYTALETQDMNKTTEQMSRQMESDLGKLRSTVRDWAPWNDTYRFMQGLNDAYVDSNLMYETISNLGLRFMIFVDPAGRIKYCRVVDPERETAVESKDPAYSGLLKRHPDLLRGDVRLDIVTGYALLDGRLVRVAASPILTSGFEGPAQGTLVVGNFLDGSAEEELTERLQIPLTIQRVDDRFDPAQFSGQPFRITRPDRETIIASVLFADLSGKPLFILDGAKKRSIYLHGGRTLNYLLLAFGAISLVFILVMTVFVEKTVLYRLSHLSEEVKTIAMKARGRDRIPLTGKDEISSLSHDINRMLDRIWESEERYRILFDSASDAILLLHNRIFVDCNLKAQNLFDCRKIDLLGKNPCFLSPDHQPNGERSAEKFEGIMARVLEKEGSLMFEWQHRRVSGTLFEAEVNLTCICLPSGNHIQAIVRDITRRKQEQRLMMQNEKMMSLGGLAAGMAHEINNPLAGMMQNAQVIENRLSKDLPANDQAAREAGTTFSAVSVYMEKRNILKLLRSIVQSGNQAAKIVENMLQFARKGSLEKTPQDIVRLLDKTIDLASSDYNLKTSYDFRKITIIRDYEVDQLQVLCDGSSLQQVFFNIIKNAAEAFFNCEISDRKPELIFRVQRRKDAARIEIEDNGPGIDEMVQKRVFEPFYTTKGPREGTGLGLSVSYFIVAEDHGGDISVDSKPGEGTTFTIRLPLMTTA